MAQASGFLIQKAQASLLVSVAVAGCDNVQ
jgi:hypothetical protein